MEQKHMSRYTTHPVLLIAAVAVVLFCTFGIAAIMGWLPNSMGSSTPAGQYANVPMGPPVADAPTQLALQKAAAPPPALPAPAPAPRYETSGASYAQGYSGGSYAQNEPGYAPQPVARPAVCSSCGVVESVSVTKQRAQGSGLGAGAGAVVGGLLGNQVGGGTGRKLATVAGAVGGAVVGNQVEGNMKASTTYNVRVRMENGKYRTFHTSSPSFQAGEHVKVVKGVLHHR
ncbi:glycine zipper 2TM domain-containing protein [Pseudoduganella sp. UC29_106]|uniref:glycine zipper 2TM domain-containing protein n=1 Tax=Pseudoduganella sp. UC29_106 TaxID=3374553 RepID=UPI0037583F1E